MMAEMTRLAKDFDPDIFASIDARGFLFSMPLALSLKRGTIMVRKAGKLPGKVLEEAYARAEYGTARLSMHASRAVKGKRVVLCDDLLATGGTLAAAEKLVERAGGQVAGAICVIELTDSEGKKSLDVMWLPCRNMPSSQPPIFTYNSCSWMVYDWASSVLPTLHTTFVFAVYFTTILSPDNGTFAWAMMTAIAALATGLLAPVLGHLADKKGLVKKGLILTTCLAAIAVTGLWFAAPEARFAALALGLSGLAIFFSELAFIYYNSLLPKVPRLPPWGGYQAMAGELGYAGAVFALLLVLGLFILPETPFFALSRSAAEPSTRIDGFCRSLADYFFPASVFCPP